MSAPGLDPSPVLEQWPEMTDGEIASIVGVTRETVSRWRNGHRGIPRHSADRIACHTLRVHPTALWPDSWCPT